MARVADLQGVAEAIRRAIRISLKVQGGVGNDVYRPLADALYVVERKIVAANRARAAKPRKKRR